MTLHSHYTAEHEINRCTSSSWRFTDDILYPFGSNIFFLFIFIRIKKKKRRGRNTRGTGSVLFSKFQYILLYSYYQSKREIIIAYKVSFCIFHVSFRIIRLVAESCNRVKRDPPFHACMPRDTRAHKMKFLTVFSNLPK